jgi:hypothetical protein
MASWYGCTVLVGTSWSPFASMIPFPEAAWSFAMSPVPRLPTS